MENPNYIFECDEARNNKISIGHLQEDTDEVTQETNAAAASNRLGIADEDNVYGEELEETKQEEVPTGQNKLNDMVTKVPEVDAH